MFMISFAALLYSLIFGLHPINYEFIRKQYRNWRISKATGASTSDSGSRDHYTIDRS